MYTRANTALSFKNPRALLIAACASFASIAASCLPLDADEHGTICVYTPRGEEQVLAEVPEFIRHASERGMDIRLHCTDAPRETVYCPARWSALAETGEDLLDVCADDEWSVVRQSTGTLLTQLESEKEDPIADVIWGLAITHLFALGSASESNILEPYSPRGLALLESAIIAGDTTVDYIDQNYFDSPEVNKVPLWTGIDAYMLGICVNKTRAEAAGATWLLDQNRLSLVDLLGAPEASDDPEGREPDRGRIVDPLQGAIALPNPTKSGTGFVFASGILHLGDADKLGSTDLDPTSPGWDWLMRLHSSGRVARYTDTGGGPCKAIVSDETPGVFIGITFDGAALEAHRADEDEVLLLWPQDGESGYMIAANALVKKSAQIKPAAQTFLDWASDEAMPIYAQSAPLTALTTESGASLGYPSPATAPWVTNPGLDFRDLATRRAEIGAEWLACFCPEDPAGTSCPIPHIDPEGDNNPICE